MKFSFVKPNIKAEVHQKSGVSFELENNPDSTKINRPYHIDSIPSFKSINMDFLTNPQVENLRPNLANTSTHSKDTNDANLSIHSENPITLNSNHHQENANSSHTHIDLNRAVNNTENIQGQSKDAQVPPIYKYYPSNNRFLFKGKFITGGEPLYFCISNFFIILPCVLFAIFVCPYLWTNISIALPLIFIYLFFQSIFLLWRTSFSDPGIVPKKPEGDYIIDVRDIDSIDIERGVLPPPPARYVNVDGIEVRLKYCNPCGIYRPPRTSHCSQCDSCIERMDHHCLWVNNCIGRYNYRYFFFFITSTLITSIYILILSILHLYWAYIEQFEAGDGSFLSTLSKIPATMFICVYTFLFTISLFSLFSFHVYLVMMNKTTHEKLRAHSLTYEGNPFNKGNIFLNCQETLCSPLPKPSLNWRSRDAEFHTRFQLPTDFEWV